MHERFLFGLMLLTFTAWAAFSLNAITNTFTGVIP
ncbi:hypothetical protein HYPP_02607 [Hyphomicrobium sp. ghe19]|nr:hypothetical protein HYPP_02607 [Hyphomicrobium sp. ghe19]